MPKEIQVLFLDDDEGVLRDIQRLFGQEAYGISTTTDVERAMEVLRKEKVEMLVA